ncbi:hypothetical protein [Nucisporomicrobium flavum]|uniref:hypothetical protein n=1 Tax=Nucisporomicrobium flavum TaxID=2785915 RepID=UPI0018F4F48D|nr:hypothetical protein [Nucisporomicrobium flavum]
MNRTRARWAAGIVLAATAGTVALVTTTGSDAHRADLPAQITDRMRTTLERSDPAQHHHAGHQPAGAADEKPAVICGVRVYGYEPAKATELADVRTVYGFHLCGVAEQGRPWDVAVKLAGPVILDMSTEPPGIQVVEATDGVPYAERLRQMFPGKYAELAQKEALTDGEMADLRRRYDAAAGL